MSDLIEALDDLIKQATTEKSHFYTANLLKQAKAYIFELRLKLGTNCNALADMLAENTKLRRQVAHWRGKLELADLANADLHRQLEEARNEIERLKTSILCKTNAVPVYGTHFGPDR